MERIPIPGRSGPQILADQFNCIKIECVTKRVLPGTDIGLYRMRQRIKAGRGANS